MAYVNGPYGQEDPPSTSLAPSGAASSITLQECQDVQLSKPCSARLAKAYWGNPSYSNNVSCRASETSVTALPHCKDTDSQIFVDPTNTSRSWKGFSDQRTHIFGRLFKFFSGDRPKILNTRRDWRSQDRFRSTTNFKRIGSRPLRWRFPQSFRIPPLYLRAKESRIPHKTKWTRRWERFVEEYRKNYCPRRSPKLVLPQAPTDKEKYQYIQMKRPFLLSCDLIAFICLAYGAWRFASASPIYSWFALFVSLSEFYVLVAIFVAIIGKEMNLVAHEKLVAGHPLTETNTPTVDIYLPVCKEPLEILENTWNYIGALQYPIGRISVFVLDDGADESVKSLAKRFEFNYLCRPNRPELKKAGNLRYAFGQTSGDFFVVFDADFCPRADFLRETMPYLLADETRAILQTPQFFRALKEQTWIEQGAGAVQQYVYRVMQPCRDRWGASICVGSNAIYRRAAFAPIGGTVAADCSEDIYTGLYAVTHEWSVKYIPLILCCGICPDTPRAFFSQQMRWCHGTMSLLSHREFWKGNTTVKVKLCYLIGFVYYISTAIQPFLFPLLAPVVLLTRPDLFKYYNLFFAFPSLILGFPANSMWARGRYPMAVQYADRILAYACFQTIWDILVGSKLSWSPSGGNIKAQKNYRYRNMRLLAGAWTLTHTSLFVAAATWRVGEGLPWYHIIPVLVMDAFNFLWMHRFLLYQHPKE